MVHIKKVDIFGFKSFGFKTTSVNFEPGLISISGPNGSGKSNILDAIMFAMGENKARVMRAPNLRELIHDIEGNRHGPKLTRVKIQFDNSDRKIPVNSDSVILTREMNDKGESTYYLDSKKINRNRILDLFEMANAGLNQLNSVQQGTVTRISEFTNEEKRKTIEDIVGLSYFDEKKEESIKQLTEADQRLEVALARMGEVKKQIDELEVERNLKLRHEMVGHELDRFKAMHAASKLKILRENKSSKESSLDSNLSKITDFGKTHQVLKNEFQKLDKEKSAFLEKVNAYNQAKFTIDKELSAEQQKFDEADSRIKTSQKRITTIEKRFLVIKNEIEQMNQDQGTVDSELEDVKESITKINKEKTIDDKKIENVNSEFKSVLIHQSQIAAKKTEFDNKIQELKNKLYAEQLSESQIISQRKDVENKINENKAKNKIRIDELSSLKQLRQRLESVHSTQQITSSEIRSRITKLSEQRSKIENDISELELILAKSSKAANSYSEKIKLVKEVMHEDYTISQLKDDTKKLGIDGIVYEILSWDKQYERAMLAASSDWIKAMVVPDFETLVSLAQVARDKNLPKLKIIPLNAIPEFQLKEPKISGVLGVLSDHIKCDKKYRPIAKFLFGNVILTKTSKDAHTISKSGYNTVSIDGEFFKSKSRAVILDIDSKISKLTKIIHKSSSVNGLLQSITSLGEYIQKKKSYLKKIEHKQQNYLERLQVSETSLGNASHSNSNLEFQINSASQMNKKYYNRISELHIQKERLATKNIQISSSVESLQQRIRLVMENYSGVVEQKRVANEIGLLNEKKSSLITEQAEIMKRLTDAKAMISVIENRKKFKRDALTEEESSLNTEKNDLQSTVGKSQNGKDESEQNLRRLREKEQENISTSGTSISHVSEFDTKLKEKGDKEREITREISHLERESDGLKRDLISIKEDETSLKKILGAFDFDESIETFDILPLIQSLEKEQNSLSTSVNAIAPQRYVEISTGYRSMSTRKNDLEKERNTIWAFIDSVEKDKRQTFLDAFDIVDKEIRTIFTKMNGGNAWLELENEDDIFNSGISYLIQFPNKNKRESTSISGGEKTLAATVFVLALQKLKPSPFYLFDEIDAHLDAPNSENLSKIVKERSKGSQFIMVSLKDSVVEKAKLIYGVYPKNGVSHVITYKDKRLPPPIAN